MRRTVAFALLPLLTVLVLGTLGYVALWHWSWLDALFMTVITVGTVGYAETQPLTDAGRIFTMFLIGAGVASAAYAVSRIVDTVIAEQIAGHWEERRMKARIDRLRGHSIVAGTGRVGSVVARELASAGVPFVVVDSCQQCIEDAQEAGWLYVAGDATEDSVLLDAGIERAASIVTALDTDAQNLFVTVTSRALNSDIFIVARSAHETSEAKLLKAGANRVLTPNVIGGRRMAAMVLNPEA